MKDKHGLEIGDYTILFDEKDKWMIRLSEEEYYTGTQFECLLLSTIIKKP